MNKVEKFLKQRGINPKIHIDLKLPSDIEHGSIRIDYLLESFLNNEVNIVSNVEIMQKRKEIVNEWNKAGVGFTVCADEVFVKSIKWFKKQTFKKNRQ